MGRPWSPERARTARERARRVLDSWLALFLPPVFALVAYDLLDAADAADDGDLNGECLGLVRMHMAGVGIEAGFADDVAMLAARRIRRQQAVIEAYRVYRVAAADHRDHRTAETATRLEAAGDAVRAAESSLAGEHDVHIGKLLAAEAVDRG